jgi:hypothetical protein
LQELVRPLPKEEVNESAFGIHVVINKTLIQRILDGGVEHFQARFEIALQMHA